MATSSITELFDAHGVTYVGSEHHHVRPGWIGVDCPKCSPGWGKYRLGFEEATGRVNCWFCGAVDAYEVISLLCHIDFDAVGRHWRRPGRVFIPDQKIDLGRLTKPKGIGDLQAPHRRYLKSRGYRPDEIARLWRVQGIGIAAKLMWRLFIPIFDDRGTEVSWTTRSIKDDAERRYISASAGEEAYPHKSLLYGAHLARHAAVIVEGPTDAWAIGPGCVATCGVGWEAEQLYRMAQFPVRAICFDRSPDALRRADRLCRELSTWPGQTDLIELESGDDPATADPEERAEIRRTFLDSF